MAQAKKRPSKKKPAAKKPRATTKRAPKKIPFRQRTAQRITAFLSRRPHRSFRRTYRRDYKRSLALPGYFGFTARVFKTLNQRKNTFLVLMLVMAAITALLAGIASQDTYTQVSETLSDTSKDLFSGGWGELGKAGLLLMVGVSGNFGAQPSEPQQIYTILILLLTWLSTVWLLRAQLAAGKPRVRDALYNAGSPIVSTALLFMLLAVQLIPLSLAFFGYSVAMSTGFLSNPLISILFFIIAALLVILSLYLVISTAIALVVVTLPGMYPWQALRTAGDLVIGRRLRVLYRLCWLAVVVMVGWIVVMVPMVVFTTWLQTTVPAIAWLPIVPIALLLMSTVTVIFVSAYIYLLYRGMVDDDAKPA